MNKTIIKCAAGVVGAICGAGLGIAGGFGVAMLIGYISQVLSPNDPSASSVAIVVLITAPYGFIGGVGLGGIAGWKLASRWIMRRPSSPLNNCQEASPATQVDRP